MAVMAIGALDRQSPDSTAASTLSRRASSIRSWSGLIRSRQIASYFPDALPSIVWRRTVAPSVHGGSWSSSVLHLWVAAPRCMIADVLGGVSITADPGRSTERTGSRPASRPQRPGRPGAVPGCRRRGPPLRRGMPRRGL